MLEGGCFCRLVRYRIAGATFDLTNCHCSICRRTSGAAFVTWFSVAPGDFVLVAGQPASFASSEHGRRSFCPRCGTPLTFQTTESPAVLDVTTCSLDRPEALPPAADTWVSAKLPWVVVDRRLAHHREARSR